MLDRIDQLDRDIADIEARIEEQIAPFAETVDRLDEIPEVGHIGAAGIIAEIGLDMTRFPTPGHLASWARFTPIVKESAGRSKSNSATGHGNRYLARILGQVAVTGGKSDTFLGERYRRIARRRGNKKAIVAVGRSTLIHHLAPAIRFHDLGPGFYEQHRSTATKRRQAVRQLESLGFNVIVEPAA